jgi:hypothetical protein
MRYLPALLSVTVFAVVLAAPSTSYRNDHFTFREQAAGLSVFASAFPATLGSNDPYVPVQVAVALMRNGASVAFTSESFTLTDAKGNRVPAAGYLEIKDRPQLVFERSLIQSWPINLGETIVERPQIPSDLYAPPGRRTRISRVELAPFSWFKDVVYFPRPPAGLGGVMTLTVAGSGGDPIDLKFTMDERELSR